MPQLRVQQVRLMRDNSVNSGMYHDFRGTSRSLYHCTEKAIKEVLFAALH